MRPSHFLMSCAENFLNSIITALILSAPIPSEVARFNGHMESNMSSSGLQRLSRAVGYLRPPVGEGDLLKPMPAFLEGLKVCMSCLPVRTNLLLFF